MNLQFIIGVPRYGIRLFKRVFIFFFFVFSFFFSCFPFLSNNLKNKIPVFCPAITDGSLGDLLYFHSYKEAGFIVDINKDIRKLNSMAVWAKKSGQIILGNSISSFLSSLLSLSS